MKPAYFGGPCLETMKILSLSLKYTIGSYVSSTRNSIGQAAVKCRWCSPPFGMYFKALKSFVFQIDSWYIIKLTIFSLKLWMVGLKELVTISLQSQSNFSSAVISCWVSVILAENRREESCFTQSSFHCLNLETASTIKRIRLKLEF
jgi:hypothetical protein